MHLASTLHLACMLHLARTHLGWTINVHSMRTCFDPWDMLNNFTNALFDFLAGNQLYEL